MKKVVSVLIIMAFVFTMTSVAMAGDRSLGEDAKKAGHYVGGVCTGSVNTVGEAAKEITQKAVSPFVAFWRSITGKGIPQEVVTDPINKGGKAVYDTTVNTGNVVTGKKR